MNITKELKASSVGLLLTKPINISAINRLHATTEELVTLAMQEGFYGSVCLELVVTDGIVRQIKTNINRNELIEKN